MDIRMLWVALVCWIIGPGCSEKELERPSGVPESAVWSGGPDGGNWFLCQPGNDSGMYACEIWSDYDGSIFARGIYQLCKIERDESQQLQKDCSERKPIALDYSFFDGSIIFLKNGSVLLPDGYIDYPFDEKSGKKRLYDQGDLVGEEKEYNLD